MIILSALNALAILICMYAQISKKYKTKSKDVTIIFICLQILFTCNLWLIVEGSVVIYSIFAAKNFISLSLLAFCMYSVRKKEGFNIDLYRNKYNFIQRLALDFENIIIRTKKLVRSLWQSLKL